MARLFWNLSSIGARFFSWRRKNKAESNPAQIKFAPKLRINRDDGWELLELLLVNRSKASIWVGDATVVLTDLDANWQSAIPTGQAIHKILQYVGPNDSLTVSLATTIYDAPGRPQGPSSCFVLTNVRYRVFDEWCNAQLETYHVEMAALAVFGLRRPRWYDKKIKQSNAPVEITSRQRKC
jgi:hypothetical protein